MTSTANQLMEAQDDLRRFVRMEHEAQRSQLARIWSKPLDERIEEGWCVTGGRIVHRSPPSELTLRFPANDSRFRSGDFIRISRGDPEQPLCEAVVLSAEDELIELQLWRDDAAAMETAAEYSDLQLDVSSIDLERYFLEAIDDLAATEAGRDRILPLLGGTLKPKLDVEAFDAMHSEAKKDGFDEEQANAVASGLASDLCWLIHGPPGTGKTRVLAWTVAELLQRGERVLITSPTHRTINNLLEAVAARTGDRRNLFKIAPFRDPGLGIQQFGYFSETGLDTNGGGYAIGATPFAVRTRRLRGVDFDTVVIDEASQMNVALAVMAMLAGKRYVFAGDHRQLPPVCLSRPPGEAGDASVFGRLVGRGIDTMLTTTHRLNEPLCEWPSESFYLSRLLPSPAAGKRRFRTADWPAEFARILAPEPAAVWLAVPHAGSRTASPEEVEMIAALLRALSENGVAWNDIGVVVPFRRQARLLRQRLRRGWKQSPADLGLVADTVERMQGQEREVVIVSFTTSDPVFALKLADFLLQPERLNVAATRPRTKLILLASPDLVELAESTLGDHLREPFLALLRHAERVDVPPQTGTRP